MAKAYTITVNGTAYDVEVEEKGGAVAAAPKAAPKAAPAPAAAPAPKAAPAPAPAAKPVAAGATTVTAPMLVKFWKLNAKLATLLSPAMSC